jgi:asparagine synthase (glutamine-hydrolysing)
MCGIYCEVGSIDKKNIFLNSETISHRGRDGSGFYFSKNNKIFLRHFRLSIIDLDVSSNQPMLDSDYKCTLIFNGEIYNYQELKKLYSNKYKFKTNSDSEVILAGYIIEGIDFLPRLRGMFAFIIYDERLNKVLVSRDRFGIKPLYYKFEKNNLYFSSEIKALIDNKFRINEKSLYHFLQYRQLDYSNNTFFDNVFQFPPAHFACIDVDKINFNPILFWNFPSQGDEIYIPEKNDEELDILFEETLKLHMLSDVPIGSFLSGGIDSSVITSYASNIYFPKKLHTFSGILPIPNNENRLIPIIQQKNNIIPHDFLLDGKNFFKNLENVIYYHDEPLLDGSMYSHFYLCKLAKQTGIKVLLSGSGGDELFGGYNSHIYSFLGHLLKSGDLIGFFENFKKFKNFNNIYFSELLLKTFQGLMPSQLRNFKKKIDLYQSSSLLDISPPNSINFFPFSENNVWDNNINNNYYSWTSPPYLHYEDRNSMANGLEVRVPFYDHVLIERILKFSPKSIMNGKPKQLLRNFAKNKVDIRILNQNSKFGFPSPIDSLLRNNSDSLDYFNENVLDLPFIRKKNVIKLGNDFIKSGKNLGIFWRLMSLGVWYKKFKSL